MITTLGLNIKVSECYGGQGNRREQLDKISRGVDICVACPGRLKDFMDGGNISMKSVKFLILDECDRMLDMGFEKDIRYIINCVDMPKKEERITLMCSATIPPSIKDLAMNLMRPPVLITVGYVGKSPAEIDQQIY